MSDDLQFLPSTLKEWQKLSSTIREQFKKKLAERLETPRIAGDALHGLEHHYKIKLRSAGYHLVYRVEDQTVADRELCHPDFQRLIINSDMDLAPDAAFRATVLASVPLAFALDLGPDAVDRQVQWAFRPATGDFDLQALLTAAQGAEVGKTQSKLIRPNRLSTNPIFSLSAILNSTFMVRQVWMAASLWSGCRPRLPIGVASQVISGSNQPYGD